LEKNRIWKLQTKLGLSLSEYLSLKQEVNRLKSEEDESEDLVEEIKRECIQQVIQKI